MDARVWEGSQLRRTSIKRPWAEDTTLPEEGNGQFSEFLPPIDTTPYRRPSIPQGIEFGALPNSRFGLDSRESTIKKTKIDGRDYNTFPRQTLDHNGGNPPPRLANAPYTQNQAAFESHTFSAREIASAQGPADSRGLCWRCRRLTIQDHEMDDSEGCEQCKQNPELAWVTQVAATGLTQLAETLRSGISSEHRGIIRGPEQRDLNPADCPPIAVSGLKRTLMWISGKIDEINYLADNLVRQAPAGALQNIDKEIPKNGTNPQNVPLSIMKRRIDVDSEDAFKGLESTSDARSHTRRRSVTTAAFSSEELPSIRSQPEYHPSLHSLDGRPPRVSMMNPPPAPNRQLPSPPGRSLSSPTSINFPSPSAPSYGSTQQSVNLPLPSSIHQSTVNNYLPPIARAHSPDSALRDHTASLQHEVSVQKIALSSLQGEHDKLLAAFSRSQTRASALEKKHAVSDTEIISLTEEKLRLQTQVIDLERDIDELSRSRDEFRQAAVQEGSQYIEIVKKASQLEEMAGEERKAWNKLKGDMERRIEALSTGRANNGASGTTSSSDNNFTRKILDDTDTNTPTSSVDLKFEPLSEPRIPAPTSYPVDTPQESAEELRGEIRHLRERCSKVEEALRAIRDDSRFMEDNIKALQERADSALADGMH